MVAGWASASVCAVCGSTDIRTLVDIPQVPVHCNLLWTVRQEALDAPKGDIELGFCSSCGHISNLAFEPTLLQYDQAYENSLHFSPRFREYAKSLASRLIERYALYSKDVIEIGSGQGDFLRLICDLGGNRGLGFDPSYVPDEDGTGGPGQVTFIQDVYTEQYAHHQADLICCRHVLEHVEHPIDMLATVRRAIGNRPDTVVYFEVPNMLFTLRELAIWDVIYEHCSYFSVNSLVRAFGQCGFQVCHTGESFAGQFLWIEALPGQKPEDRSPNLEAHRDEIADLVEVFAAGYRRKMASWQSHLAEYVKASRRVVVWGAGSKGVTFLNALGSHDQIEYVVDINPRKQGMYVAGTGQQIVPPEFLADYQPDVLIIMNSVYESEIRKLAASLGLSPVLTCA